MLLIMAIFLPGLIQNQMPFSKGFVLGLSNLCCAWLSSVLPARPNGVHPGGLPLPSQSPRFPNKSFSKTEEKLATNARIIYSLNVIRAFVATKKDCLLINLAPQTNLFSESRQTL